MGFINKILDLHRFVLGLFQAVIKSDLNLISNNNIAILKLSIRIQKSRAIDAEENFLQAKQLGTLL